MEWISVDDRLPSTGEEILFSALQEVYMGHHDMDGWFSAEGYGVGKVTHWMPIPAPPEA